ncbi:MAG TPA: hypothetical protein VL688_04165 [Verrucomicrobiae bacterium]|jgi:hypothetical protein|nr:hypothetical protein [Verrucomicrobiae bacterium]
MKKLRNALVLVLAVAALAGGCAKDDLESLTLTNAKQDRAKKLEEQAAAKAAKETAPAAATSPSVQPSSPV